MKSLIFVWCLALLALPGCVVTPPHLSPAASWAFNETRIIKSLDVLRDVVVDANAQKPPLVREAFMLATVKYHRSALVIIHAHALGWQSMVNQGTDELVKHVPANEAQLMKPYAVLLKVILNEVK